MSIFHINLTDYFQERFDFGKFMDFEEGAFNPITSDFIYNIKNLPQGGTYKITFAEKRPDQLSSLIYDEMQYWWIIMLYNDIYDLLELTQGTVVKYPTLSSIEDFYFSLRQREKTK